MKCKDSVFDRMIKECFSESSGTDLLDECMTFNVKIAERVPLRYRLIAMGFVKNRTLDEVNKSLTDNNCAKLYSRNIWESTLIYAFINGLQYNEWKELAESVESDSEKIDNNCGFPDGAIRFADLEKYVRSNSSMDGEVFRTQQVTRKLDDEIKDTVSKRIDFHSYIRNNIDSFTVTREKTRYYFCKYLYYMLLNCMENIIASEKMGLSVFDDNLDYFDSDVMVDERNAFRCMTNLSRKKMSLDEISDNLRNSPVSCSVIYDGFNQFFYDYVVMDWMDILMEKYEGEVLGNFGELDPKSRNRLANAARNYRPEWHNIPDDEEVIRKLIEYYTVLENEKNRESEEEVHGKKPVQNRLGENVIRKYIRGQLDIGRTTLICFILYFGNRAEHILPPDMVITRDRLSGMLLECGYAALRDDDDFDYFVAQYLESDSPREYLISEVTRYSGEYRNSPIYQSYRSEGNYYENLKKAIFGN